MEKRTKKIKEHQYISDIIDRLQTNCIYQKPTGGGITHLQILAEGNGVIIEVNKPVIQGKCKEFNQGNRRKLKIRGVYEGVTVQDIVDYLQSDVKNKKLISTPESYFKIVEAVKVLEMEDEFYDEYFFLFDECEHTIQDVDFRYDIVYPIDDFFKFKNKAFVSATPIIPSDPRFKTQRFKFIQIVPDYEHKQDISLIATNNCLLSFKDFLKRTSREHYFIFLNSTKAITTIINFLKIPEKDSYIFCSDESKNKLKLNKINNAESTLVTSDKFRKFNFFTSRFNSAVDILDVKNPEIIIISDLSLAQHSKVDPYSELIQIVGRFRKPKNEKIKRNITHITNTDTNLQSVSDIELMADISRLKMIYISLKAFLNASTTLFARVIVEEMLLRTAFANYITKTGDTNHFMIDNARFRNRVNNYYKNPDNLKKAYQETLMFKLNANLEEYIINDEIRLQIKQSSSSLKTSMELLLPILNRLEAEGLEKPEIQDQLEQIRLEHPTAYNTFKIIGFEKAKDLNFSYSLIQREIARIKTMFEGQNFALLTGIQEQFKIGWKYTLPQIKSKLRSLLEGNNLKKLTPGIDLLNKYFNLSNREYIGRNNGKTIYGYTILSKRF